MTLTFKDVAEILKIIDASQCEEVVLELAGMRLEVRRGTGSTTAQSSPLVSAKSQAATSPAMLVAQAAPSPPLVKAPAGMVGVHAPSIGMFYRRPSPTEKPFVEVGQHVKAGDPLCLIEVMKLYTTICAPAAGTILALVAVDGALVEFDQLLITIKPS